MAKKRRICFIDDEQDELSRTARVLSQHFTIGTGANLDTAMSTLPRRPHVFLLDMYYGPETQPQDRVRVAEKWQELSQAQRNFYDLLRSLHQSSKGGLISLNTSGHDIPAFRLSSSLERAPLKTPMRLSVEGPRLS